MVTDHGSGHRNLTLVFVYGKHKQACQGSRFTIPLFELALIVRKWYVIVIIAITIYTRLMVTLECVLMTSCR